MEKTLSVVGCVLLLAAAAPAAGAHWDWGDFGPTATTGVAGNVVGVAGPALTNESGVTSAEGLALCDLEVSDPRGRDSALNEPLVDEEPTVGELAENTWEDGGYGAACHTDHYVKNPEWNSPGCGDAPHSAARAHTSWGGGTMDGNSVTYDALFVGAGCDFGTSADPSIDEQVRNLGLCTMNDGTFGGGDLSTMVGCIGYITNPGGPVSCESQGGTIQTRGAMDAIHFGYASPFTGPSVPHTGDCFSGTTVVFVFASLDISGEVFPAPAVSANVFGHVWTE